MAETTDNPPAEGPDADRPQDTARPSTSATIREVEQLVRLMVDNDLTELDIEEGSRKILLKRRSAEAPVLAAPLPVPAAAAEAPSRSDQGAEAPEDEHAEIKSPMVGTFYTAASPDSRPFVSVGDAIEVDDVVCIVEAMKVMNEIKADCSGTIAEICMENAQPVEFGQVLFRVRPT